MRIDVITLFPQIFDSPLQQSILKRAQGKKIAQIHIHNLRDYTTDRRRTTDDRPYGGGPGMVLKPEPVFKAVETISASLQEKNKRVVLLSPQGNLFDQAKARELAKATWLIFICGHYEGVDERIRQRLSTDEISIGDYILTGGELPALVVIDAVVRLLPGVVGNPDSVQKESFSKEGFDWPQYTRPANFRGLKVPEVLLSGNHATIAQWRQEQARKNTSQKRPSLLHQCAQPIKDKKK